MNRRELLKSIGLLSAGVGLSTISAQLLAAPATQNRLLFVFLRGGYDASHLLVPTASQFYYDSRPTIAIAKPGADPNTALELNAEWGLHPALRDTIYPMFKAGEAAFIPFAGIDDLSRSHFETQDSIEMGQDMNASRNYQSGFLNRLAAQLNSGMAMSFTDQLPIILRGDTKIANTALRTINKSNMDDKQSKIITQMYNRTALEKQVNDGFEVRGEVVRDMQAEMQNNDGNRNAITTKGFELEAKRIAKMMRDK